MTVDRLDLAGASRLHEWRTDLLPVPARSAALRWTWCALAVVLLVAAGAVVAIAAALW